MKDCVCEIAKRLNKARSSNFGYQTPWNHKTTEDTKKHCKHCKSAFETWHLMITKQTADEKGFYCPSSLLPVLQPTFTSPRPPSKPPRTLPLSLSLQCLRLHNLNTWSITGHLGQHTHTHAAVSNRQLYYILTVIDCTPPVCGPNRFTSWLLLSAWVINTIIEDKWTEKEIYVIPIKETHQAWLAVKRQWHDDANALTGSFTSSNTRTNIEHNKH